MSRPGSERNFSSRRCSMKATESSGSKVCPLTEKPGWTGLREDPHAFRHMTEAQQDAFIREHPDYGRIVCRCETVSEGEIRAAIRRNPQAWDVDLWLALS